jgi:hypothetical protein
MALDLDAIRRKLQQYSGATEGPKVWKKNKELGEHRFRIIPWQDLSPGEVFKERQVYFRIGKSWIVSPKSFGKHDPIDEFASKLWQSGKPEDKALAKKLFPQLCICAAIIDRDAEDEGPQLFVMDKKQAAKVIGYILNDEYGDVTDIQTGTDLRLIVKETDRIWQGKKVKEATIEAARKESPLTTDKAKLDKWLKSLPSVDEYYKPRPTEEIKAQFEEWLNSGGAEAAVNGGVSAPETTRGTEEANVSSELDALANGAASVSETSKPEKKKSAKKTIDEELEGILAGVDDETF